MEREHQTKKHRNKQRNKHTLRLLDQVGPEGRGGENYFHFNKASLFFTILSNSAYYPTHIYIKG